MPTTDHERYLAGIIADALAGKLHLTIADAPRLAAAARQVQPDRIGPMALAAWIDRDPDAKAVLFSLLGHA
jgi:hypothetical protein